MSLDPMPEGYTFTRPAPEGGLWPLEASAGTGKTWNIENFVADYLARDVASPEEIVIVTFTRSATAELRARIRQNIADIVAGTRSAEMAERYPYTSAEVATLKNALGKFGQIRISTIHGFAQRSLSLLGEPMGTMTSDVTSSGFRTSVFSDVIRGMQPEDLVKVAEIKDFKERTLDLLRIDSQTPHGEFFASTPTPETDLIIAVAEKARRAITERKKQLGLAGYNDLLTRLNDRLANSNDALAVARTMKVLLIDEFQDTDSVQWEIFQKIQACSILRAFVVVGDPKQSIYGFRGGDVQVYREAVGDGDINVLKGNRRSSAALVAAANEFLGGHAYGFTFDSDSGNLALGENLEVRSVTINYEPVEAVGGLRHVTDGPAWLFRDVQGKTAPVVRQKIRQELPGYIAGLVTSERIPDPKTGISRPISYSDICILASGNELISDYLRVLHDANIPASVVGGGNVFSSDAAMQWRWLLGAVARPSRVTSARLLQWTWFGGRQPGDIAANRDSDTWFQTAQQKLFAWHELFTTGDRFAFYDAVIRESGVLGFLSKHVVAERNITDVQHIAEILRQRATDSLEMLVEFLQESISARQGEDEEPDTVSGSWSRRIDGDLPAVQLMTIHQSKGLQFPIVLIPYLGASFGSSDKVMAYRAHRDGVPVTLIDVTVSGDGPGKSVKMAVKGAEHKRKAYVALTRAQVRNVMWSGNLSASAGVLRDYEWRYVQAEQETTFGWDHTPLAEIPTPDINSEYRQSATSTVALPSAPLRLSYTAITDYVTSDINDGSPADREPTDSLGGVSSATSNKSSEFQGLSGSALLGKVVHRVLQTINVTSGDDRDFVEPAVTAAAKEFGFALDKKEKGSWSTADVVDLVITSLTGQLGDVAPGTTLADYGDERRLPEMGFDFNLGDGVTVASLISVLRQHLSDDPLCGPWLQSLSISDKELAGFMTGSIDAVLAAGESDDPRFFIVDYKSNGLRDFSTEGLHRAMSTHHYQLQALIYLVALHRFVRSRLGDAYDYDRHIAGAAYLFLRGMKPDVPGAAVMHLRPSRQCIDDLSNLLNGDVDVA